jgi:TRAP transporter TAXI family solute receptor
MLKHYGLLANIFNSDLQLCRNEELMYREKLLNRFRIIRRHKMRKCRLIMVVISLIGSVIIAEDEMITIGSGNTVGMYYATSSAIAKIFNQRRQECQQWVITQASQGSEENINHVIDGKIQFGLAQDNMLVRAQEGMAPWEGKPQKNLQAVLKLYTEKLAIVAAEDAGILSLSDLRGKRVNIGAPGSSDAETARIILERVGVPMDELTISQEQVSKASDLFSEGKIDAYFFTVGHPDFSVREASFGKRKVRLLPLDQSCIEHCLSITPLVKSVLIETDFYPGLNDRKAVPTLGVSAVLFTHADMSEDTVYRLVKEIMTNLDLFRRQQPVLACLEENKMCNISMIELHPGAKRYFQEVGLLP